MTAPRSWTLRLAYDVLPLSLNDRQHHMARYRQARLLRDRVRWLARHQKIPRLDAIHVEMHWTPRTKRRRDQDNAIATLKPAIDGLRDYPAKTRIDTPSSTSSASPSSARAPMRIFPTEGLALAMVGAVRAKHGADVTAYPCRFCNGWHIAKSARTFDISEGLPA